MSFRARRELLVQVAARYLQAGRQERSAILDEFVASTGFARKYAIRLLSGPVSAVAGPIRRRRQRRYGSEVQEALRAAWEAANRICSKRLVPFLPTMVASLERHRHLDLDDETRAQLLTLSAATADRILAPTRNSAKGRGLSTTKPGALLKRQIQVRTFADWDDLRVGFMEADLVAHCGSTVAGSHLHTLVLTDVVTAWTECAPLRHRGEGAVPEALDEVQRLLPFPLLGLDTDNGGEFLNAQLLGYCERESITFTRGRPYRKNDQCYVEQKNGVVVRQLVGYDRFEGELAFEQLAELYRPIRLHVNFFQPSMKLMEKHRDGARTYRRYDTAATPFERLSASGVLAAEDDVRLRTLQEKLDPVRLLAQIGQLQDALWRHAVLTANVDDGIAAAGPAVPFDAVACGVLGTARTVAGEIAVLDGMAEGRPKRKYHRTDKPRAPRTWRTRIDPFAEVWDELQAELETMPVQTGKELLATLQTRYPGEYADGLLRTLQRRVSAWRAQAVVRFTDPWTDAERLSGQPLPGPLSATTVPDGRNGRSAATSMSGAAERAAPTVTRG